MHKQSLTFFLIVAILYILSDSDASPINSVMKNTDTSELWQRLANLSQNRRVIRQTSEDLWGGYSNADAQDYRGNYEEGLNDDNLQPQIGDSTYDEYSYSEENKRYRRASAVKEHKTTDTKIEENGEDKEEETAESITEKEVEVASEVGQNTAVATPTTSQKPNQFSVLILIRDTLKKVTSNLPTEQVASNALQYFQLFEHFLQQTIEQVIDDVDEEDEEGTTNKIDELEATTLPNDGQEGQDQNKPDTEDLQMPIAEPVLPIKKTMESRPAEISAGEIPMSVEHITKPKTIHT